MHCHRNSSLLLIERLIARLGLLSAVVGLLAESAASSLDMA
jgi:hypothetical protein